MSNKSRSGVAVFVANNKGGVGKSTLTLSLNDKFTIDGFLPVVVQVDNQEKLSKALSGRVVTIKSAPDINRSDPSEELRRFSPILDQIERARERSPVLIDIGAGEVSRFAVWAGLVDLDEDLCEWNFKSFILVPFVSEAEAIRQAAWTVRKMKSALPSATIVLVENRRDGQIVSLHPASAAAAAMAEHLRPLADCHLSIIMPAIPAGSWRCFESAGCRFADVVEMEPAAVMGMTGLSRAEAKIARGDVAQWLMVMFDSFEKVWGTK